MRFPPTNRIRTGLSILLCLISEPSFATEEIAAVTELTFVWTSASGPVSGYEIELTKNAVVTENYATTAADVLQFTLRDIEVGDLFSIRVRAFDDQFQTSQYSLPSEGIRIIHANSWSVGSFPTCSLDCDGLQVAREVYCQGSDGTAVSQALCVQNEPKPVGTGICTASPCADADVLIDRYPRNLQVVEAFLFSILKDASPSSAILNNSDILEEGGIGSPPGTMFSAASIGLSGNHADELSALSFSGPVSSRIYFSVDRESVGKDFSNQYEDVYDEQMAGQAAGDIYASVQDGHHFHILNQDQIGLDPPLGVRQTVVADVDEVDALDAHSDDRMPDTQADARYTVRSSDHNISGATIFRDGLEEYTPAELGLTHSDVIDGLHIDYSLGDIYFSLARNSPELSRTAYMNGEPLGRLYSPADILVTRTVDFGDFSLAISAESLGLRPDTDNIDAFTFALIQTPLASLDRASPSVENGGLNESSIYGPSQMTVGSPEEKFPAFTLGVQGLEHDDIDAFTRQEPAESSGQLVNFYFYVGRDSNGGIDTAVRKQSDLRQQAGDIFRSDFSGSNELVSNQDSQDFLPAEVEPYSNSGSQDNADALDIAGTKDPVFSLKKGNAFGVSGATLFRAIGNNDFETYMSPQDLGLSDADDIDALHIDSETGVIYFSLAPESPYLSIRQSYGPANIFASSVRRTNSLLITGSELGLNSDDDITGISFSKSNPTEYAPEVPGGIQIGVGVAAGILWCVVTGLAGCT